MNFLLSYKARLRWASSLLPAMVAVCANAAPVGAPEASPDKSTGPRGVQYSVINLSMDADVALLNGRGQAAFGSFALEGIVNGFFDGRRIHAIPSRGEFWTWLRGLNNQGVVVGEGLAPSTPYPTSYAFAWTVAGGLRALPSRTASSAYAINAQNQVAGLVAAPGVSSRATRWNPDGSLTTLGPLPVVLSAAYAINDNGMAAGISDAVNGQIRATLWDRAGTAIDLGSPDNTQSFAERINAKGQVAGLVLREARQTGFFWSRNTGMLPLGPDGGGTQYVSALNDNGEIAGNKQVEYAPLGLRFIPYIWSAGRGLRGLSLAGAPYGGVHALNNRREMVGFIEPDPEVWYSRRAVHWNGEATPVDLNTRLHRAPAGLVLYTATAINGGGTILANSNAGLVMLRPGKEGTAAPVLGPITGASVERAITSNTTVDLAVGFVDSDPNETHVASASINSDCPQAAPSVREARGVGEVNFRHTFCRAGAYTVKVKVTDCAGNATEVRRTVFVVDPDVPTLSGQGALTPAATPVAGPAKVPVRFAVWAPLDRRSAAAGPAASGGAAAGSVEASGPFHFRAEVLGQPERIGQSVRLTGSGRYNGRAGYRFSLEASPAQGQRGGTDRLRLRISHTDAATRTEVVDYDNGGTTSAAASTGMARAGQGRVDMASTPGTLITQGHLQLPQ